MEGRIWNVPAVTAAAPPVLARPPAAAPPVPDIPPKATLVVEGVPPVFAAPPESVDAMLPPLEEPPHAGAPAEPVAPTSLVAIEPVPPVSVGVLPPALMAAPPTALLRPMLESDCTGAMAGGNYIAVVNAMRAVQAAIDLATQVTTSVAAP